VEQGRDKDPQRQSKAAWSKAAREPPKRVEDPSDLHPFMVLTIKRNLREWWCKPTASFPHEHLRVLVRHASDSLLRSLRLGLDLCDASR